MAPASRSKRRTQVVADSDQEEEAEAPQQHDQDEGEAESQQSTSRRRSKGKGKKAAPERADHSSDEEDHYPKLGDVQAIYLNQPLEPKQTESKLKVIINDLTGLKSELETTLDLLSDVAENIATLRGAERDADLGEEEVPEDPVEIQQIEKQYRLILDKMHEIESRKKTLSDLRQKVAQGHPMTNIINTYEDIVKEKLREYDDRTARQRYLKNDRWTSFRSLIWETLYEGAPVPNMKSFLPVEPNDEIDSDDEIEIGPQTLDFRCPLSAGILEDPVTSTKCPHSYSRKYIMQHVPAACPVAGCPIKSLTKDDLRDNPGLKKRVEAYKRRLAEEKKNGGKSQGTAGAPGGTQYETVEDSDEEDE